MKFNNLILAVIVLAAASSCSKDKVNPPAVPPAPVDKTIAILKFNGDGSDSAGKILLSSVTGTTSYVNDRNGNPNSALYLNGSSKLEYLSVPFKGQALTMAAWVKFGATGMGSRNFVVALDPVTGGMSLLQSDDRLGATVSVPGTNAAIGAALDNAWHHLAMTYDGKEIKVYVDGILTATQNHPGSMGDESRKMVIGAFGNTFWKGTLDDLRIYSETMTAAQVQQLMSL